MSSWRKTLFSLLASVSCLEPQFGAGGRSKQLLNCEPAQDGLWPLCLQTCPWVAIRMAGCVQLLLFLLVLYPAEPSGWCLLLVSSWTVWVWLGGFSKDRGPLSDQQVLIQLPKESSWSLYHSWQIYWKWCPLGSSQKRSPERIRHEGSWAWSGGDRKGGGQSTGRSQVVTAPCTLTPRKQASQIFGKPIHADSIYILILLRSLSFYLKSKRSSGKMEACWLLSFGRALSGKFGKRMLWRDLCLWRSKRSIWKWREHCMYPHRELTRFLIIQTAAAFEGTISQRDKATFTTGLLTREVDLILILQMRKHREVKWFSASS